MHLPIYLTRGWLSAPTINKLLWIQSSSVGNAGDDWYQGKLNRLLLFFGIIRHCEKVSRHFCGMITSFEIFVLQK